MPNPVEQATAVPVPTEIQERHNTQPGPCFLAAQRVMQELILPYLEQTNDAIRSILVFLPQERPPYLCLVDSIQRNIPEGIAIHKNESAAEKEITQVEITTRNKLKLVCVIRTDFLNNYCLVPRNELAQKARTSQDLAIDAIVSFEIQTQTALSDSAS